MSFVTHKLKSGQKNKKKPPPRPPPPNFSKYKSKSSYNLNQNFENLIEWSPPNSPTVERTHTFGGSVSSSFSSSTSSLASSKKSFEYDITNNLWPVNFNSTQTDCSKSISSNQSNGFAITNTINGFPNAQQSASNSLKIQTGVPKQGNQPKINIPPIFGPTIIRPSSGKNKAVSGRIQNSESPSPPMPSIPPPSPPKDAEKIDIPYGIALYDYQGTDPRDLSFQTNDVIILLRRINREWLYGKVLDTEGMFPANFIDIQVPLDEDDKTVMALYEFNSQMEGDLKLKPGQVIRVLKKLNDDWYYGESNGQLGQFPVNFVDRIPNV